MKKKWFLLSVPIILILVTMSLRTGSTALQPTANQSLDSLNKTELKVKPVHPVGDHSENESFSNAVSPQTSVAAPTTSSVQNTSDTQNTDNTQEGNNQDQPTPATGETDPSPDGTPLPIVEPAPEPYPSDPITPGGCNSCGQYYLYGTSKRVYCPMMMCMLE